MKYISPIRLIPSKESFQTHSLEEFLRQVENDSVNGVLSIDGFSVEIDTFQFILKQCYADKALYDLHLLVFNQKGMLRMLESNTFNPLSQLVAKGWNKSTKEQIYAQFGKYLSFALNEFSKKEFQEKNYHNILQITSIWEELNNEDSVGAQLSCLSYYQTFLQKLKDKESGQSYFLNSEKELSNSNFYSLLNNISSIDAVQMRNDYAEIIILHIKNTFKEHPKFVANVLLTAKSIQCEGGLSSKLQVMHDQFKDLNKGDELEQLTPNTNNKTGLIIGLVFVFFLVIFVAAWQYGKSSNEHIDVDEEYYGTKELNEKNRDNMIQEKLKKDQWKKNQK